MTGFREYSFLSDNGVSDIYAVEWTPEGPPRGALQIVHGIDEHIMRYDDFARWLAERGFLVAGNDHIGHGRTVKERRGFGWFSESDGWSHVIKDVHTVYGRTRAAYPDVPYFMLGHSMGSFLARTYLTEYPGELNGCLLSGTGQPAGAILSAGRLAAAFEKLRKGQHGKSKLLTALAFGPYSKAFAPNRTAYDWLSRDEAIVDLHEEDPFCGHTPTVGLFQEMFRAMQENIKPQNLQKMKKDTPIYFFSGQEDPVGDRGKGVKKTCDAFLKAGCTNVQMKLYPGARHEMLNELNRAEAYRDVLNWMEEIMA